ncbi:hypothetical protein G6F36_015738 [Rhizopus arrhizus]|nr:hypothetical protein G6F36_015738 [Rhizopus arrhizus]
MAAGVTKRNITTQSSATPISFVSGVEKSIHNPKNASGLSKQGQPQFKPKSKCFVHGKGNHTSEQCKVLKRITTANTATTTTKIPLLTSTEIKSRGLMAQLKLFILLVSPVFTIEANLHLPLST